MDRDQPSSPSLSSLLTQYTARTEEREVLWKEGTRACREQQKGLWQRLAGNLQRRFVFPFAVHTTEIERLRETVSQLQAKLNAPSESVSRSADERTNLNYKAKYEEAEAKCRQWESRVRQLENGTIKPLQEKIEQLQRDYQQMQVGGIASPLGDSRSSFSRLEHQRADCRDLFCSSIDQSTTGATEISRHLRSVRLVARWNHRQQERFPSTNDQTTRYSSHWEQESSLSDGGNAQPETQTKRRSDQWQRRRRRRTANASLVRCT